MKKRGITNKLTLVAIMTTFLVSSQITSPKEILKQCESELRRVSKGSMIIMTFDPAALDRFWNAKYFPELIKVEKARYPSIDLITNSLKGHCDAIEIPIPLNCFDGFQEALYGRPEAFLKKEVRLSQSAWGFLSHVVENRLVKTLHDDLKLEEWIKNMVTLEPNPFLRVHCD
jgi:hypothetical protein